MSFAYTYIENRSLSRVAGAERSTRAFRDWVLSDPANGESQERMVRLLDGLRTEPGSAEALAKRLSESGVRVAVTVGLAWSPDSLETQSGFVQDLFEALLSTGIETHFLRTLPLGTFDENAVRVAQQLEPLLLEERRPLVLMGMCKGSPDLLGGLAFVAAKLGAALVAERCAGVLNLSGLVGGTYVGDAFERPWLAGVTGFLSRRFGRQEPPNAWALFGALPAFSSARASEFMERVYPRLPRGIPYLSAAGVATTAESLLAEDSYMQWIRRRARNFRLTRCANDAFIEYPRMLLQKELLPEARSIVFESSHLLLDGRLGPHSFPDRATRTQLFLALYAHVLELGSGLSRAT
jgi:hypothetical protein